MSKQSIARTCTVILATALLPWLWATAQLSGWNYRLVPSTELTASASDTSYPAYPPANAVDGNVNSYARINDAPHGQWFQLDAGHIRMLTGLEIYSSNYRIKDYEIYVSDEADPINWGAPVASGTLPDATAWRPITFAPAYGRYLRLVVISRHSTTTYINEVRLYEAQFLLASIATGHNDYANSNIVTIAALSAMTGYDSYQITDSPDEPTDNWLSYDPNAPPLGAELSLGTPTEGKTYTRYAWFKDEANDLKPTASVATTITYLRDSANVTAIALPNFYVPSWGNTAPADIRVAHVDNGSHSSIGLHSLTIKVAGDLLPEDPTRVILTATGTYTLTLIATDNAGNIDTTTCALTVFTGNNDLTTVWTGAGDGSDWHDNANWNNYAPAPGSTAFITNSAAVSLQKSSATFSSLIISNNATLTFSNWDTTLSASNVTIGDKGTLTHDPNTAIAPDGDGNWLANARVRVECNNLHIASDAIINVNGKGFAGGPPYPNDSIGYGPGGGGVGSGTGGGGGYGGDGYGSSSVAPPGKAYLTAQAPTLPGSGGGSSSDTRGFGGEPGGGLIEIYCTGLLSVDGAISANGANAPNRGGAGSGGAIIINCGTFTGTNGTLKATGGTSGYNGWGGGGRIAIYVTDTTTQATLPPHRVIFNLKAGGGDRAETLGTLHVADPSLLDSTWLPHDAVISLGDIPLWHTGELTISGWMQFKPYGDNQPFFNLTANSLSLDGNAARLDLHQTLLTVATDLVVTNSGRLFLYAAATSPTDESYGALVDIAGTLLVGANSWIYPASEKQTGISILLKAADVKIMASGGINATGRGYAGATGPGKGVGANWGSGAGYGGKGGDGSNGAGGETYGSATLPLLPGSGGGRSGSYGGGLVWIEAEETISISGSIIADGAAASGRQGGGAGGAVLLQCHGFHTTASTTITTIGGDSAANETGGGGGGRIAIWYGDKYAPNLPTHRLEFAEEMPDNFAGTFAVTGGVGVYGNGEPGTINFIRVRYPAGTLLILK